MRQVTCPNGHVYDADRYSSCNYCNQLYKGVNIDFEKNQTIMPGRNQQTIGGRNPENRTIMPENKRDDVRGSHGEARHTVAPSDGRKHTVAAFSVGKSGVQPIVGWLVCVEGPALGKDYHLWPKINKIGRDRSADVCISEDPKVSAEQAKLAYDDRHNMFTLIPGAGSNHTYLNDMPIYESKVLSAYDVIEFGDCKLFFVPFCCDKFQWKKEN